MGRWTSHRTQRFQLEGSRTGQLLTAECPTAVFYALLRPIQKLITTTIKAITSRR